MASVSSARVQSAIFDKGFDFKVIELPANAHTAEAAAKVLCCSSAQIAKSLVFKGKESGKAILVLASGINRVNENVVAQHVGEPIVKADPAFVRDVTGFAIGGIPPLGHLNPMTTFIDEDLLTFSSVWAAGGTPNTVFCITTQISDLVPEAKVIALKQSTT